MANSVSLRELTKICEKITGNKIEIGEISEERSADLKLFITDCDKIKKLTGWKPKKDIENTISDITKWIQDNKEILKPILS